MPTIASPFQDSLESLGAGWVDAIKAAAMPELVDGPINRELIEMLDGEPKRSRLKQPSDQKLWPELTQSKSLLAESAMWLLAGDLDRSHEISQSIDTANGSLLHGIMHRREGDFSNAKYWFRRASDHPVLLTLASDDDGYRDPFSFVDACEDALRRQSPTLIAICQSHQWTEWQAFMNHLL